MIDDGYEAHKKHIRRTDNPHLKKAMIWDNGWVKRQKEELPEDKKDRVTSFSQFVRTWFNR